MAINVSFSLTAECSVCGLGITLDSASPGTPDMVLASLTQHLREFEQHECDAPKAPALKLVE